MGEKRGVEGSWVKSTYAKFLSAKSQKKGNIRRATQQFFAQINKL